MISKQLQETIVNCLSTVANNLEGFWPPSEAPNTFACNIIEIRSLIDEIKRSSMASLVICDYVERPHSMGICTHTEGHKNPRPFFGPSAPQPQPRWIRQEDQNGCVVAAIAMIVGRPYSEVKAALRPKDLSTEAYTTFDAESYLYEHGYSLLKKWKHVCFKGDDRETWPIPPFAPVHYVQVVNGPSGKGHAVVMLANGDVLDPWTDATPKKLTDYYQVNEIIGVFGPSAPSGSAGQEPRYTDAKNSCNRHADCAKANEEWLKRNPGKTFVPFSFHCHSEDCEDCFGQ